MPTGSADAGALDASAIVGVVGAGTMGSGIAQVAAAAGHPVRLFDMQPGAAERAKARVVAALDIDVSKSRTTREAADALSARLIPVASLEEMKDARLIVEAIIEDLGAKQSLIGQLEALVAADTILASNTSSISITAIAAKAKVPGRVVGMHFFNPVPRMRLVEIVTGLTTGREIAQRLSATATAWGKRPVLARSTPGFIVNRIARPFYSEGLRLLGEQVSDVATLDFLLRAGGGFRMGPFEVMDLVGNDVNYAVTSSIFEAYSFDPRFKPSLKQRELVDAGFLGRKSGRGYYDYEHGTPPATTVARLIDCAHVTPEPLLLRGKLRGAEALAAAGWPITVAADESPYGLWSLESANGTLAMSDGRCATELVTLTGQRNVAVCDWWRESPKAACAVAYAWQCADDVKTTLVAPLKALGAAPVEIADTPGLVVLRTVAMLANEAAEAVHQGVASAADIDLAMRDGVNYPQGPLEWAQGIGLATILGVLAHLHRYYEDDRYRASPLLRHHVWAGRAIKDPAS